MKFWEHLPKVHSLKLRSPLFITIATGFILGTFGILTLAPSHHHAIPAQPVAKKQAAAQQTSKVAGDSVNAADTTSNSPSSTPTPASGQATPTPTANGSTKNSSPAPQSSKRLIISPSTVTFDSPTARYAVVNVTATTSDNLLVSPPTSNLTQYATITALDRGAGTAPFRKSWTLSVQRGMDSPGQVTATITAFNGTATYTGQLFIVFRPISTYTANKGALTSTDDGTNTTFTTHFSITPGEYFGNSVIHASLTSPACIGGTQLLSVPYTGQSDFSLSCTLSDISLSVSMSSPHFTVNVSADNAFGDFTLYF
jgi:hypothetical protein